MKRAPTVHLTLLGALCAGLFLAASGCASHTIARSGLPEDVIAIRMWENESARRRIEIMPQSSDRSRDMRLLGVMDLNSIASPSRSSQSLDPADRYPGRLALINPRTLDVTFPDQAPLGARPLSWSHDHERLIFASNRQYGRFQIYELDFATGEVNLLAASGGNVLAAAYAPDAGYAYGIIQLDDDGELEAQIVKSEPRMRDRVLAKGVAVRHIAYSPDGRHVAFTPQTLAGLASERSRMPQLVVQETELGGGRNEIAPGVHPVFSPDGQWIVYAGYAGYAGYAASRGDRLQTYRVRTDGSGRTAIGAAVRDEETPAISPDGEFVVYVSPHNGLKRLFVKRFDGTGDRLLYDGAAVEWPIW